MFFIIGIILVKGMLNLLSESCILKTSYDREEVIYVLVVLLS